jgi:hypothetical protein
MDIFDETILNFWRALKNNGVRYIMIGGFATNMHGFQRYTGDMDIWIDDTEDNRSNLIKAFDEEDMGLYPMIKTMQFVPGWTDFHLNNGLKLDILTSMVGLDDYTFDESLKIATVAIIDDVEVYFLHISQLIANKKKVNRPKDKIDVIELEQIRLQREE